MEETLFAAYMRKWATMRMGAFLVFLARAQCDPKVVRTTENLTPLGQV